VYREKYDRLARHYNLLEKPLDRFFEPLREKAVSLAEGRTLEVGVGTGKTLGYYPPGIELYAVDGSGAMLKVAEERAKKLGLEVRFQRAEVESLPFPDGFFDTVVSSFTFCTVPDPERGMGELHRVLKPSGRAVFLEHTRSESRVINTLFLRPLGLILGLLLDDDPLRDTRHLIGEFFEVEREERYYHGVVRLMAAKNPPPLKPWVDNLWS